MKKAMWVLVALAVATAAQAADERIKLERDGNTTLQIGFNNNRFEGMVRDGSQLDPNLSGNPRFVPGYVGGGVGFTGNNMVSYPLAGLFNRDEGTIEGMMKFLSQEKRGRSYVVTFYINEKNRILLRFDSLGAASVYIVNNGAYTQVGGSDATLSTDEWYHFALAWSRDGKTSFIRFYLDGKLLFKRKVPFLVPDMNSGTLHVGNWISTGMPFNGILDEIRLSDVARYNKGIYPELMSNPPTKSQGPEIEKLGSAVAEIQNPAVQSMLQTELDQVRDAYKKLLALDAEKASEAFQSQHVELDRQLSAFRPKVGFAQWWGGGRELFRAIPYTCMDKVDGVWDPRYASVAGEGEVSLRSAGHEWQSFQILLAMNPASDISSVDLTVTDLKGQTGTIGKENIRLHRVGVTTPTLDGRAYRWADPIYPVAASIEAPGPYMIQPIWVNVHVPSSAAAGEYEGSLILSVDGEEKAVAIHLEKYGFALPVRPRLETAVGFSGAYLAEYYNLPDHTSERFKELNRAYLKNMLEHKVSPKAHFRNEKWNQGDKFFLAPKAIKTRDGTWKMDFADYERQIDELLPLGLNTLMVGNRYWLSKKNIPIEKQRVGFSFPYIEEATGEIKHYAMDLMSDEMKKHSAWYLGEWYGFLKEKGIEDMAYTYIMDEPAPAIAPNIDAVAAFIHSVEPNLRNMVTMVPSKEYEHIDLPCPMLTHVTEENAFGNYWTYVCMGPTKPNLFIDLSAAQNRLTLWASYESGATGFLYYEHALSLWKERDVWNDPLWAGMYGTAGDGFLVYPGEDGPVNTVRFEYLRMGIQDVEYFLMLKDLLKDEPAGTALRKRAARLLAMEDKELLAVADSEKWERNEDFKHAVALIIEQLQKGSSTDHDSE